LLTHLKRTSAPIHQSNMTSPYQQQQQPFQLDKESVQEIQSNDKVSVTTVQIDANVLLKMINHCSDKVPNPVNGILLGLNKRETLEVTNCFPMIADDSSAAASSSSFSSSAAAAAAAELAGSFLEDERRYQVDMLKCLRDVNVDCNTVGWYQSTFLESFMNAKTIDAQYQHQMEFGDKCVHLVFDPVRTRKGQLFVKAYRLTAKFFDLVKESIAEQVIVDELKKKLGAKVSANPTAVSQHDSSLPASISRVQIIQDVLIKLNMTSEEIFEELPIVIHNISLVKAFLFEIAKNEESSAVFDDEFDNLDLSSNNFLEKSLESLLECSDDLNNERNKYQLYQRRIMSHKTFLQKKGDRSVEEQDQFIRSIQQPSQLETLLLSYQMNHTCRQINKVAGEQVSKLYLANALFRRENEEQ